jgi:hypothetical protein
MDPTMQSPFRRTIPVPPPFSWLPTFSDGVQITLPSGPHYYPLKNWVGSISQGNTAQQAFEALSPRATPFQSGPSVDGGVEIPGAGPVRQFVDPEHLTIVNTTQPGHILHAGNVFRSIVQEGDNLYVVTHGYGTGIFPTQNKVAAPCLWGVTDLGIRRELNPYTLLGYPMDEINASADVGSRCNARPSENAASPAVGNGSFSQAGLDPANPMQPAPPQTGGMPDIVSTRPVRSLGRVNGDSLPASGFEPSAPPAAQFALPDSLKSTSGVADWIAAIAGIDPQNPTQAARSSQADQLRGFYGDDPLQPWFVQRPR